jgi:PTS system ascorbate-specific IIA component
MITTEVIDKLIQLLQYKNLPLPTVEKVTGRTRRNLLSDIDQVNDLLGSYQVKVKIDKNDQLKISEFNLDVLIEAIFAEKDFLFQQERPNMVILYLFLKQDFVSANHFQDLFKMSKNSVLSDINVASDLVKQYDVRLTYSRKNGYELLGHDLNIRRLIDRTVSSLLTFNTGKWILQYVTHAWNLELKVSELYALLEANHNISFVNERLEDVVFLMAILEIGPVIEDETLELKEEELEYIRSSKTYELSDALIKHFPRLDTQKSYITIQLLSVVQGGFEAYESDYFRNILEEVIITVQGYAGSIFPDTGTFRRNLYNHLVPSYFRMKFHIQIHNPLKDKMLHDYPELFYLIKRSLQPFAKRLNIEVSDDEVAYFVMHFGSYFPSSITAKSSEVSAIILCPHGTGTSLLVQNRLSSVMPEIHFTRVPSKELKPEDLRDIDLIISTVFYESEKPVYMINPSMNHLELSILKRAIYERFNIETKSLKVVDELYDKIESFTDKNSSTIIKSEMDRVLDDDLKETTKAVDNYNSGPLLTEKMIVQESHLSDWQEAIKMASTPLFELGYITENYIEAMINAVKEYGSYIVLAPKVALPHAKPEDGSQQLGVSLLQLNESVLFEDEPVNLIFVVSISDNYSHLGILKKIHSIIEDEEVVEDLIKAKTKKDILKIISNYD